MRFDDYTVKAQEALAEAERSAAGSGHPEIEPGHLLQALLGQQAGVVPAVLEKLGVSPGALASGLEREVLGRLPRGSGGGEPRMSQQLRQVLESARRHMAALK